MKNLSFRQQVAIALLHNIESWMPKLPTPADLAKLTDQDAPTNDIELIEVAQKGMAIMLDMQTNAIVKQLGDF